MSLLPTVIYVVQSINSIDRDPRLYFFCSEMSSLIRCSVVWNELLVEKPFCEFTYSGAGRDISNKGQPISRICDYFHEDDASIPQWCKFNVINLAPDDWFITWEAGHTRDSVLFFALDKLGTWPWALEGEIQSVEYLHSVHPYRHGHIVHGTIEQGLGWLGKRQADIHSICHFVNLIINSLLCSGYF